MSRIKVGDKVVGFKFECEDEGVHWSSEMEAYVGREGNVEYVGRDFFVLTFNDGSKWSYPISQVNEALQREEENQIMVDQDLALEKDSWKFYRVANEPLEL